MKNKDKFEIENIIEAYFDGIEHECSINMNGVICDIILWYRDFKSPRNVRRDLESIVPNLNNIDITRDYGDEASAYAICHFLEENPELYVKNHITQQYEKLSIPAIINEISFDRDIC